MREQKDRRREPEAEADGMIEGRNAVMEGPPGGYAHRQDFPGQG